MAKRTKPATSGSGDRPEPSTRVGPGLDVDALFALPAADVAIVQPEHQSSIDDFMEATAFLLRTSQRQIEWLRNYAIESLSYKGTQYQWAKQQRVDTIESIVSAFRIVKKGDAQVRDAWLQQKEARFIEWVNEDRGDLAGLLRQWSRGAREALAPGQPPLTREAAESWAELSLISTGTEPDAAAPTAPNMQALIASLGQEYPALSQQQQAWIAFAPMALYELRRSWPALGSGERNVVRRQLSAKCAQVSQKPASSESPTFNAGNSPAAREANTSNFDRFRKTDPIAELSQRKWQTDPVIGALQQQWSEAQARGDFQKAAELQLAIQDTLHQNAEASAMLNKITSIKHDAAMNVWKGMK